MSLYVCVEIKNICICILICYHTKLRWTRHLLMSQTCATSLMTSWCSTRRWCKTASFFPAVFGNSLSQKIHGTLSSDDEISLEGLSGKASTSKVWWSPKRKKINIFVYCKPISISYQRVEFAKHWHWCAKHWPPVHGLAPCITHMD